VQLIHQPGTTLLHRMPAGAKVLALTAIGLVTVIWRDWRTSVAVLGLAVVLLLVTRARIAVLARTLRPLLVVMTLLTAYQVWQRGWEHAFTVVGALLGLVLLATVLTISTSVDEMVGTITRFLGPFRRLGVNPELVGLAFSLMVRAIPTTFELAEETRQAAKARGLERDPRAFLTPLVIRVVAHARATGAALHARGLGDD
jgi:biotin transport system permease protein